MCLCARVVNINFQVYFISVNTNARWIAFLHFSFRRYEKSFRFQWHRVRSNSSRKHFCRNSFNVLILIALSESTRVILEKKKTNARIQLNRTSEAMVVCVKYQLIVIGRMIYRANKMPSGFWFIFNEEIIMTRSLLDCFSSDPSQRKRIFCSVKISK